jgi:hypothetical protein
MSPFSGVKNIAKEETTMKQAARKWGDMYL